MKILSLLLLAVLGTVAWTKPSYFPAAAADLNPWDMYYPSMPSDEVSDVRIAPTLLTDSLSQEAYEEYATEQSTEATAQGYNERAEIMAQSICTAISGPRGWVFAVQRECTTRDTCANICASKRLHAQAPQHRIVAGQWKATAALHIYGRGPSSGPSTVNDPHLGFMVFRYDYVNTSGYCGPNYCCCLVPYNAPV